MKKILIATEGFAYGGVSNSIESYLNNIKIPKHIQIDLIILSNGSRKPDLLSPKINVIYINEDILDFHNKLYTSIKKHFIARKWGMILSRILLSVEARLERYRDKAIYRSWRRIRKYCNNYNDYDIAIAFKDGLSMYFVVDLVKASKKILWNHVMYEDLLQNKYIDSPYIDEFEEILCVSEICKKTILNKFSISDSKVKLMYNYIDKKTITMKSEEEQELIKKKEGRINIVTVGRLTKQKGIDIAIKAAKLLRESGIIFEWFVFGEGTSREYLTKIIEAYDLINEFHLIGSVDNPYKYVSKADIYVQPSRYEGFGLTVAEAKILEKPIIVTNIEPFKEQIVNEKNGLICELTPRSLYKSIIELVESKSLRETMINGLRDSSIDYSGSITRFERLLNDECSQK